MHIPEKITLVPHHLIQAEIEKQRKWIHWRQRLNPFRNSTKSVRTKIQQTIILEPALGRPNVSSSNSCWNLGKQRGIGSSKGSNTTSFGMSAIALPCGEYGLWRIVHITMDAVAYLIIEWPNISNQWPDNMAQHARTEQSWTFESTSQNAVSPLRNHFSQAPSSVPSALTLSVTRCGTWPGEAMKLTTTRSSLSTTCRRSSESKLPAGCCHASVWWVLTSEKSRQTNCDIFETSRVLMCSLDLLKRHVGDEKRCY